MEPEEPVAAVGTTHQAAKHTQQDLLHTKEVVEVAQEAEEEVKEVVKEEVMLAEAHREVEGADNAQKSTSVPKTSLICSLVVMIPRKIPVLQRSPEMQMILWICLEQARMKPLSPKTMP